MTQRLAATLAHHLANRLKIIEDRKRFPAIAAERIDKPLFILGLIFICVVYFAPGATHAPHHVPKEWADKYKGQFDDGWDVLRDEIVARQKELGVIPADAELTPRPDAMPAWDSLSETQRRLYARQASLVPRYACREFNQALDHTLKECGRVHM